MEINLSDMAVTIEKLEEITRVMKILAANEGNIQKTSKEVGISRPTLFAWKAKYGHLALEEPPEWEIENTPDISVINANVMKKQVLIIDKMLDKISYLLARCTSPSQLDYLARSFKNINEISSKEIRDPNDLPPGTTVAQTNVFNTITNILKLKYESNGTINNTPDGDSTEPPGQ